MEEQNKKPPAVTGVLNLNVKLNVNYQNINFTELEKKLRLLFDR